MIASSRTTTPSPDLHPVSEPRWIDDLDQVVLDKSAAVTGLSGTVAQVVLQQGQRAGEAGELDQDAVDRGRNMRPDNPYPSPGEKAATDNEADEQQMDNHHKVSANSIPHHAPAEILTQPQDRHPVCEAERRRRFGLPDPATIVARGSCRWRLAGPPPRATVIVKFDSARMMSVWTPPSDLPRQGH